MTLWQGIVLGLVQGLTEFLPVSSSGHLRVLEVATGVHTPGVFVEVALHVATLGSVLVVYGARLWAIARGVLARRPAELRTARLLVLATLVAAVGAVPLAVSFALAFASGIWSIRFLVALLQRGHFYRFAPYNWTVGVLTIVYALWRA